MIRKYLDLYDKPNNLNYIEIRAEMQCTYGVKYDSFKLNIAQG